MVNCRPTNLNSPSLLSPGNFYLQIKQLYPISTCLLDMEKQVSSLGPSTNQSNKMAKL